MATVVKPASEKKAESFQPKSTFIESASWDADSETMTLTFKTGSQYAYNNVGYSTWASFKQSPDHSSYYANAIKGNLQSTPIVRRVIGKPKSKPLQKVHYQRSPLDAGNIFNTGSKNGSNRKYDTASGARQRQFKAGTVPDALRA